MLKTKSALFLFILCILTLSLKTRAQNTLEVVTRIIEKSVPVPATGTIHITGENATIHIDRSGSTEMFVRLKLIAKHRIKSVAVSEVENIKYIIDKRGKDVYLRNYFIAGKTEVTGSILKVEYELTVPAGCGFEISDNLGDIELKNAEGPVNITTKYGNVTLDNVKGEVKVDLTLGDLKGRELAGAYSFKANHAHIELDDLAGKYQFKLTNSDLAFHSLHKVELLQVDAKNGNVAGSLSEPELYNYDLKTTFGDISAPDFLKNKIQSENHHVQLMSSDKTHTSFIHIYSEFGNITLNK